MAQKKITEKEVAAALLEAAHVLVTQQERREDGTSVESLRRVPLSIFFSELYDARKDNNDKDGKEVVYSSLGEFLRSISAKLSGADLDIDFTNLDLKLNEDDGLLYIYDTKNEQYLGEGWKPTADGGGSGGDLSELEAAVAQIKDYMYSAEKVARYVTGQEVSVAVDTAAGTVTVSEGYLFYRDQRIPVAQASVALLGKAVSVHNVIVYDTTAKAVRCVPIKQFDGTSMFIIAILWDGKLTDPSANWIPGKWSVDEAVYPQTAGASAAPEKVYVSTSGSDSNSGENGKPFKTLGKAIASGAKTVIVAPGIYREAVSVSRSGGELEIIAKPTSLEEKDVVIELGKELAMAADSATGLVKAQRAGSEADFLYRAFVSGTEQLFYDDSFITDGHSCDLWLGDTKLVPVATVAECQATEGTWTYDGSFVYANGAEGSYMLADGESRYGIWLGYFKRVKLSGIVVRHAREDAVRLKGCLDAQIHRCVFSHSSLYNGLALEYTSATVRDCEAAWNRTDGFNIHGVSTADFIGCVSHDNGDDGISHHDRSGGMVIGGEYYNNGKGGVCSPTFGSRNGISGVYIHGNGAGVYAVTGEDGAYPLCTVSGCRIQDNGVGIRASRYALECWNISFAGNGQDVMEEDGGKVTVHRECADVGGGSDYTPAPLPLLADVTSEEALKVFEVTLSKRAVKRVIMYITVSSEEPVGAPLYGYINGKAFDCQISGSTALEAGNTTWMELELMAGGLARFTTSTSRGGAWSLKPINTSGKMLNYAYVDSIGGKLVLADAMIPAGTRIQVWGE